jgi:Xaa-Pro aminopeptidase
VRLNPHPAAQRHRPELALGPNIPALGGHTAVDFERRIDHDRLRRYRLSRAKAALEEFECGTLLLFDVNNIRYVSAHQDRRVGTRQDVPLLPADRRRGALCLGLRLGGHAPQEYCDWLEPDHAWPASSACAARSRRNFGLMKR